LELHYTFQRVENFHTTVNRRLAWKLYNRDMYCYEDDINVICELLAVKHGDLELDLFSNSVLDAFNDFLCNYIFTVCLFLCTLVQFSQ